LLVPHKKPLGSLDGNLAPVAIGAWHAINRNFEPHALKVYPGGQSFATQHESSFPTR
jgi:hypothetical protein